MKEYMLFIRNEIDHQSGWKSEKHELFLKACEVYIKDLKKNGHLKSAQPLIREGKLISGSKGSWKEISFNEKREVIVGYYHILASSLEQAIEIAKGNPEFEFSNTARVEVRPVKLKEETTEFTYPD